MASQGFSWLLQFCVLLMLAHPLDPSSHPEGDMGTSSLLREELERQDSVGPGMNPLVDVVLVSWTRSALELLIMGLVLGWFWRRWGEVREGGQAGGTVPGPAATKALGQASVGRGLRAPVAEQSRVGSEGAGPPGQPFGHGPSAVGAEPLGGNRAQPEPQGHQAEAAELFLLQPLPGAAQPGPSLSRRGQGQCQRAQPRSAPLPLPWGSLGRAVQEKRRSPWGCAGRAAGTWLPQGAAAAGEAQPRPDAAVPAPPLSAEAQSQDTSKRGQLQEEETPRLPSALTLQLQLGAQLAGHRGGCVTSAQPGHCDIPQLRGQ